VVVVAGVVVVVEIGINETLQPCPTSHLPKLRLTKLPVVKKHKFELPNLDS